MRIRQVVQDTKPCLFTFYVRTATEDTKIGRPWGLTYWERIKQAFPFDGNSQRWRRYEPFHSHATHTPLTHAHHHHHHHNTWHTTAREAPQHTRSMTQRNTENKTTDKQKQTETETDTRTDKLKTMLHTDKLSENAQVAREWTTWNLGSQPKSKKKPSTKCEILLYPRNTLLMCLGRREPTPKTLTQLPHKSLCARLMGIRGEGGGGAWAHLGARVHEKLWKKKKVKQQDLGEKRKRKDKNTWNEMKHVNEKRQREKQTPKS